MKRQCEVCGGTGRVQWNEKSEVKDCGNCHGTGTWDPQIQKVEYWAEKLREAQGEFEAAIREARAMRSPLRTIAAAAGLSHQTIQNIVSRS